MFPLFLYNDLTTGLFFPLVGIEINGKEYLTIFNFAMYQTIINDEDVNQAYRNGYIKFYKHVNGEFVLSPNNLMNPNDVTEYYLYGEIDGGDPSSIHILDQSIDGGVI